MPCDVRTILNSEEFCKIWWRFPVDLTVKISASPQSFPLGEDWKFRLDSRLRRTDAGNNKVARVIAARPHSPSLVVLRPSGSLVVWEGEAPAEPKRLNGC